MLSPEFEALSAEILCAKSLGAKSLGDPTDGELLVALHRDLARLEHLISRVAQSFDSAGGFVADGSRSASAWIAAHCGVASSRAHRELARGRLCVGHPAIDQAFGQGAISTEHVDAVVRVASAATEESLATHEHELVDRASELSAADFNRLMSYFAQLADPDGADEAARARRERRNVTLNSSFGGMFLGTMTLDAISGEIVKSELGRISDQMFHEDVAEAKARLGAEPKREDLARTSAQRRADALVEMATRSRSAPADAARPAPLFSVVIDHPSLVQGVRDAMTRRLCELSSRTIVTPSELVPFFDTAVIERVLFRSPVRAEVGAKARFFSGATRRAIEVRDLCCTFPGCEVPAHRCECDHIVPYAQGGETTQENGRMLCGFHNRLRNRSECLAEEHDRGLERDTRDGP